MYLCKCSKFLFKWSTYILIDLFDIEKNILFYIFDIENIDLFDIENKIK